MARTSWTGGWLLAGIVYRQGVAVRVCAHERIPVPSEVAVRLPCCIGMR